jgi:hypothetical protein
MDKYIMEIVRCIKWELICVGTTDKDARADNPALAISVE